MKRLALLASLVAAAAQARTVEVNVLARVAGRVVTDRAVFLDAILEQPSLYEPGARSKNLSASVREQGLQRAVTQAMILEENRLVGRENAGDEDGQRALAKFRRQLGKDYPTFLADLELTESELREKLVQKLLVERILASRVSAAAGTDARKAVEDWLQQLRARYRVQYLQESGKESAKPEATPKPQGTPKS
jgi:hypothetical protein